MATDETNQLAGSNSADAMLSEVLSDVASLTSQGLVATYIPALAQVSRRKLGIATASVGGDVASAGDANEKFSIQSVSKMFTLALALGRGSGHELWKRVGREPSGDPFNSIVLLEAEKGIPRNPFINPGAIVLADILCSACSEDPIKELLELVSELSGSEIHFDDDVARSEADTGFKNKAMANYLKSFGNLQNNVDEVLDVYFRQCSLSMTVTELARSTRFLANDGLDPRTGNKVVSPDDARRINALMLMAGTYDAAGAFAFEIGIPCKSGVGGGIVGVVPGKTSICVWSPGLDQTGNSLAGRAALASYVEHSGDGVF